MAVYVQLREIKHIDVKGKLTKFYPGDWVSIGRQQAELWITQGAAWQPNKEIASPPGAGVWVTGFPIPDCAILKALPYTVSDSIPYPLTFAWQPELGFRAELLGIGFKLLRRWQMAAPIKSYTQLAAHIGSEQDREITEAVIHDLRVPVYDSRCIFFQRSKTTNEIVELWRAGEGNSDLSLLRAIYKVKPIICSLPVTWAEGRPQ